MEKIAVPFVAISQALGNKDLCFSKKVYNLLAQHILLGKISSEDISFFTEQEYTKKFGQTCSLPIFANQETLLSALVDNATSIPLISAYKNFFKFVRAQEIIPAIDMVINAYTVNHERIFCSMCRQFMASLAPQKPRVEKYILERSAKYSWLLPLVIPRLKNLDISMNYEHWFTFCEKFDIEIAEYLLKFTQISSNQAFSICNQINIRTDEAKYRRLINLVLQILQNQNDNLSSFVSSVDIFRIGILKNKDTFSALYHLHECPLPLHGRKRKQSRVSCLHIAR